MGRAIKIPPISSYLKFILPLILFHCVLTKIDAFSPQKNVAYCNWHVNSATSRCSVTCHEKQREDGTTNALLYPSRLKTLDGFKSIFKQSPLLLYMINDNHKKWNSDEVNEEFEALKMNLNDEIRELTFTIDSELQKGKPTRRLPKMTLQNVLVCLNVALFAYQMLTVILPSNKNISRGWLSTTNNYNRKKSLIPNVRLSPLTNDFMFMGVLATRQPHRYISSGFLHGGILHLLLNMRALVQTPTWLEDGLGKPLYITVYLASTIVANICHSLFYGSRIPALGSSGAICGLMGYEFCMWTKMNRPTNSNRIIRNMLQMVVLGAMVPCVSNASHIGGFAAGAFLGRVLGPTFSKSYAAKQNRLNVNKYNPPQALQRVMGHDLVVKNIQPVSLTFFWIAAFIFCVTNPTTRRIPQLVLQGLLHPGSLGKRF